MTRMRRHCNVMGLQSKGGRSAMGYICDICVLYISSTLRCFMGQTQYSYMLHTSHHWRINSRVHFKSILMGEARGQTKYMLHTSHHWINSRVNFKSILMGQDGGANTIDVAYFTTLNKQQSEFQINSHGSGRLQVKRQKLGPWVRWLPGDIREYILKISSRPSYNNCRPPFIMWRTPVNDSRPSVIIWGPPVNNRWPPISNWWPPNNNWRPPVFIWRPPINNSRPEVIM